MKPLVVPVLLTCAASQLLGCSGDAILDLVVVANSGRASRSDAGELSLGGKAASGGHGSGTDAGTVDAGAGREGPLPGYEACLQLDSQNCSQCCFSTYPNATPLEATDAYCLCESPRPCGSLCDAAFCAEEIDLSKETPECLECRLREGDTGGACAKQAEEACSASEACVRRGQCLGDCD